MPIGRLEGATGRGLYDLPGRLGRESLDLVLLSGVLSDLTDASEQHRDISELAPAPDPAAEGAWLCRWWLAAVGRAMRGIRAVGVRLTARARR